VQGNNPEQPAAANNQPDIKPETAGIAEFPQHTTDFGQGHICQHDTCFYPSEGPITFQTKEMPLTL